MQQKVPIPRWALQSLVGKTTTKVGLSTMFETQVEKAKPQLHRITY